MKELVKPTKKENQFKSVELYDECSGNFCADNYCGGSNFKEGCGYNHCYSINSDSSEENDIVF